MNPVMSDLGLDVDFSHHSLEMEVIRHLHQNKP